MKMRLRHRLLGRMRVIRGCVRSPGDAWLATRMAAWRLAVPLLKWLVPLPRLARLMWAAGRHAERDRAREERIVALAEALCGPHGGRILDNCLERSLVSYRFLSQAGAEPELVFGVAKAANDPVPGHAWIRVDGEPVHDSLAALERFQELGVFGPSGALRPTGETHAVPATSQPPPGRWR